MNAEANKNFDAATEVVPCLVCGCEDGELLFKGTDLLHHLPGEFGVTQCSKCGHVYTSPRPKNIGAYYPPEYGPHKEGGHDSKQTVLKELMLVGFEGYPGPQTGARALWPYWPFWRLSAGYAQVIPWTGKGRLFDYGCGAGQFLARMKNSGWTVSGMDFSANAVNMCRKRGLEVQEGMFPAPAIPNESFDVVTLWQSLEHVTNPREVVAEAHRILSPGGLIVIGVPAFDSMSRAWFGPDWYALDLPRHLSHFRRDVLTRLLQEVGFDDARFRTQRRTHPWRVSFGRRYARSHHFMDRLLSRNRLACRFLETFSCVIGRPAHVVAFARKSGG